MFKGSKVRCSAPPLVAEATSLIEQETDEHRTPNIERRMNVFCLFKKRFREAIPSFVIRHSTFDILGFDV